MAEKNTIAEIEKCYLANIYVEAKKLKALHLIDRL